MPQYGAILVDLGGNVENIINAYGWWVDNDQYLVDKKNPLVTPGFLNNSYESTWFFDGTNFILGFQNGSAGAITGKATLEYTKTTD